MRKQLASNSSGSGNYSPIGISSMSMNYHSSSGIGSGPGGGGGGGVTPSGASSSPTAYVLPSQSLPDATYAPSPQCKYGFSDCQDLRAVGN